MSEMDVAKMKVADLKRELKFRGLSTAGNKNELQERLQTALLDGELSLEDTAISGEDLLDGEDTVLTDEEEAKILGADENELLKSPTTTPTALPDLTLNDTKIETAQQTKKIVLKRKNSFSSVQTALSSGGVSGTDSTVTTTKENTEPPTKKTATDRKPITPASRAEQKDAPKKISQLSLQERLEMRAKKFGISTSSAGAASKLSSADSNPGSSASDQQIEILKKRAERFGCVVSSKIANLEAQEKLNKRKQRFGATLDVNTGKCGDTYAEKARLRLERFKMAPIPLTPATSVKKD